MEDRELPTVSVVIPTAGQRLQSLKRVVDGCLDDPATSEIIVAIDHPAREVADRVAETIGARPRVEFLRVERERDKPSRDRGQAGRDAGFKAATSEVLLALDDDLEPQGDLVGAHAARHRVRDDLVIMGYCPVVPATPAKGDSRIAVDVYRANYERACEGFRNGGDVLLALWGGHFSVRRAMWRDAESSAEKLRTANEERAWHIDTALGFRLRAHGLTGSFAPDIVALHRYARRLDLIVEDAQSSAYGRACLARAYPELAVAPQEELKRRRGGRIAFLLAGSKPMAAAARGLGSWVTRVGANRNWDRLEAIGVRALASIGYAEGSRAALRGPASDAK